MSQSRKRASYFFILLLLFVVLFYFTYQNKRAGEKSIPSRQGEESSGAKIIDGDTFADSQGRKIRLLGIDTPEKGEPFHDEAMNRLRELIKSKSLRFEFGATREDHYGRTLAFVFADEVFVNARLLEEGLARTYFFENDLGDNNYRDQLCEAQRLALRHELGVWSIVATRPADRYFGNPESLRFHRPGARCLSRTDTLELIRETSRDFFLQECYSPCRNCKP